MLSMKEIKKRLTVRSPFPEKVFESLLSKGTELRFKPRTPIVGPGVADDRIFLIKKGLACGVYRAKGREHTIYFAFPGDIIGSTAGLCLGKPTSISIETFTNTVVTAIPIQEVIRMAAASTEFMVWVIEWFLMQLYVIESKCIILTGDALERYDALVKQRNELLRQAPIRAIASYLGIAENSLSRLRSPKYQLVKKKKP